MSLARSDSETTVLTSDGIVKLSSLLSGLDQLDPILRLPATDDPGRPRLAFGRFRLILRLGAGRFGVVMLADDPQLGRKVVVKFPQPAVLTDPVSRERFVREAKSAARMDHPGIVPVFEAGEWNGLPYMAAAFVDGPTLAEWRRRLPTPPTPDLSSRIMRKLAIALHHAHERGVLHCDLTPSNILLAAPAVGHDEDDPEPVVTDFGLARMLEDDPTLTRTCQIAGTPQYMSPEQARGDRRNLTARTDVYALGAIFYELLTGDVPHRAESVEGVLFDVTHTPPRPPRKRDARIPRDAEAICLKCLEKNPADRYPSAGALAEDLGRFLNGHPTVARPVNVANRLWRGVRARPVVAALGTIAFLAVCTVPAIATWYAYRLDESQAARRQAERDGERDRELAETREFFATLERVRVRRLEQRVGWAQENLDDLSALAKLTPAESNRPDLRTEAMAALTAIDLKPVRSLAEGFKAYYPAYSPDASTLAICGWEESAGRGIVRLHDPFSGALKSELSFPLDPTWSRRRDGRPDGCRCVAFSPDGRWLVAGSRGGQLARWDLSATDPSPVVWNAHTDDHFGDDDRLSRVYVKAIIFSADGRTALSSSKERTRVWDVGTDWRAVGDPRPYRLPLGTPVLNGPFVVSERESERAGQTTHNAPATGWPRWLPWTIGEKFALSADGMLVACKTGPDGWLSLIGDVKFDTPILFRATGRHDQIGFDHLAFAPGNGLLVSSDESAKRIHVWDVASGELVLDRALSGGSARFAIAPDGRSLAVTELDKTVVYEITGRVRKSLAVSPHQFLKSFAVSSAGHDLLTINQCESLILRLMRWDISHDRAVSPRIVRSYEFPRDVAVEAEAHPRLDQFVVMPSERSGRISLIRGERTDFVETDSRDPVVDLHFDTEGRAWVLDAQRLKVVNVSGSEKGQTRTVLENDEEARTAGMVYRAVAVGQNLAIVGRRDGRVFIVGSIPTSIRVFDSGVTALALSPDESRALVGGERGELVEVTVASGQVRVIPKAHADEVRSLAFGPGGWFVSGSADRTMKFWDEAGRPLFTVRHGSGLRKLSVSADGSLLTASFDQERAVRRWHLDHLQIELTKLGFSFSFCEFPISLLTSEEKGVSRNTMNFSRKGFGHKVFPLDVAGLNHLQ